MLVKIQKLNKKAVLPQYAKFGDAAVDLTAVSKRHVEYGRVKYGTGLAIEIPNNYVGLLFPRSSICKTDLFLSNSVGVIDSGYRGEISMVFGRRPYGDEYEIGDRVGQLIIMPYPKVEFEVVDALSPSERGDTGFGSSGK
jgi:dUTP pyrophosphatase